MIVLLMMMVNDGLVMINDVHRHRDFNKKNTMLRPLQHCESSNPRPGKLR